MSLEKYTTEQLKELSMLEVAYEIFEDRKQAITYSDLVSEVKRVMGLTEKKVKANIAQLYTDINIDGRFICIGEAGWGLRDWYPYEQIDEEVTTPIKPKKKKGKKKAVDEDDLDVIDFDEIDEDDLEYDVLDDFDDEDDDDEDDDDDIIEDDDDVIEDEDELVDEDDEYELDEDLDEEEEEDEEEEL